MTFVSRQQPFLTYFQYFWILTKNIRKVKHFKFSYQLLLSLKLKNFYSRNTWSRCIGWLDVVPSSDNHQLPYARMESLVFEGHQAIISVSKKLFVCFSGHTLVLRFSWNTKRRGMLATCCWWVAPRTKRTKTGSGESGGWIYRLTNSEGATCKRVVLCWGTTRR